MVRTTQLVGCQKLAPNNIIVRSHSSIVCAECVRVRVRVHGARVQPGRPTWASNQGAVLPPAAMVGAKPRASIVFRDIADVLNDAELVRMIAKAKDAKARRDKAKKASKRANHKTK